MDAPYAVFYIWTSRWMERIRPGTTVQTRAIYGRRANAEWETFEITNLLANLQALLCH